MRNTCLVALLSACAPSHPPLEPARLSYIAVDPPVAASDRLARVPTFTLAFDRALAQPDRDSVWLLAGDAPAALRSEARRAMLSASAASHRIAAAVEWQASDPTRLTVRPSQPLAPDESVVLVTTSHLVTPDGLTPRDADGTQPPIERVYRIAPARDCPPLARLAFPLGDGAPTLVQHLVVAFSRPVKPALDSAGGSLVDERGHVVPADTVPACGDATQGFLCAYLRPVTVLDASMRYEVHAGRWLDDTGLLAQDTTMMLTTAAGDAPVATPVLAQASCTADELQRPPFCIRVDASRVTVRGQLDSSGAIRIRAAGIEAESDAGSDVRAVLRGLPENTDVEIETRVVALDGSVTDVRVLPPITTAPREPALRITEILARPHSSTAQQFVEVINEGDGSVDLDGLQIATTHGASVLPATVIAAGARAVIVGSRFDPSGVPDRGDPAVAPGTAVVQLSTMIAARGLIARGADVWLADADGRIISRAPTGHPALTPKVGVSIVRADPRMPEDDSAGWSYDAADGSTPGAEDRIR